MQGLSGLCAVFVVGEAAHLNIRAICVTIRPIKKTR